ncbi:MAG: DUF5050 domain-containing protein [Deltaproteobacteria bacterium]
MRSSVRLLYIFFLLVSLFLLAPGLPALAGMFTPAAVDLSGNEALEFTSPTGLFQSGLKIEPLARLGNWIYYLQPCSSSKWQQVELYRSKTDGSDAVSILTTPEGQAQNMQFIREWIYYKNATDGSLHRVRYDGTGDMQLAIRTDQYVVRDPYIFYVWVDGLYRLDIASQSLSRLDGGFNDYYVSRIDRIEGEWIYYQRVTSEQIDSKDPTISDFIYGLYRIKMDGSQKTVIIEERLRGGSKNNTYPHPICLVFSGQYIYYAAHNRSDGAILAVRKDGAHPHLICSNPEHATPRISDIFVHGNWIYYKYNYSPGKNLTAVYKVKTDGSDRTCLKADVKLSIYPDDYQIARALSGNMNIDGQWIYYSTLHQIYRINVDGTGKSMIYDAGNHDICWLDLRGDHLFFNWVESSSTWAIKEWRCRIKTDGSGFTKVKEYQQ